MTLAEYHSVMDGLNSLYQDDKATKGVYIAARDYAAAAVTLRSAMGWEPVKRLSVLQVAYFYRNVPEAGTWPVLAPKKRRKSP